MKHQIPLFGPLKDALRGRRFADDDEMKHSVRQELQGFGKKFYATGIERLMQRRKETCVDNEGDFVEEIISTLYRVYP
jgi:hypothetical protein